MLYQRSALVIVAALTFALGGFLKAQDFARGGRILLIGDSILDNLEGADRVEQVMLEKFRQHYPQARIEVVNRARGGMWAR